MKHGRVWAQWLDRDLHRRFLTGVSLHSHTMHSRESLSFIPRYGARIPFLERELRRIAESYRASTGRELDYSRGYFTPPLPERAAYELERRHLESSLGVRALVSLTDHDDVEAGLALRAQGVRDAPVSIEWTVPVEPTYFHIGVHNLPEGAARSVQASMAECSGTRSGSRRREILACLGEIRDVIVVLNHPFWDQAAAGRERHRAALAELLRTDGQFFHALELNALRSWSENRQVLEFAAAAGFPVVSGGDRHGRHPNAAANLTNARSFSEFAAEVRDGFSEVVLLNEYRIPLGVRILSGVCDIMGWYPELGARARWSDRVWVRRFSGAVVPISQLWNGDVPGLVRCFDTAVRLAGTGGVQKFLRHCFLVENPFQTAEAALEDPGFQRLIRFAAASRREAASP